jgi:dUTP pyrophosphatase
MKYSLVRDVTPPTRANKTDAGIDFYIPLDLSTEIMIEKNKDVKNSCNTYIPNKKKLIESIIIEPQSRILIPSGVHVNLPEAHALIAFNKSGIAHKKGLIVGSCVVDEGYQGEIHISLINTTNNNVFISAGDKIVQFILMSINNMDIERVDKLDKLYTLKSNRGSGGFGSTGDK